MQIDKPKARAFLNKMLNNTHTLWKEIVATEANEIFGTKIECREYAVGGGPKGLTLNKGETSSKGIACFDLLPQICNELKIPYESKLGRGFQVQACCEAIANHFHLNEGAR